MNRKQISKGLKILSIASAVVVCSATMATSERAEAGVLTRFRQRFGNFFKGRGFTTNPGGTTGLQRPATTATSAGSAQPQLPGRNMADHKINGPYGTPGDSIQVKFRGIGKDGKQRSIKGVTDGVTGNSTTHGAVDNKSVVKLDNGGKERPKINTQGTQDTSQQVKLPAGTVDDGLHYMALGARPKIKTQNKSTTSSSTTTTTGGDTVYAPVKGPGNGSASSQASTSGTNSGGHGRKPIPTPRTNPNAKPIQQQQQNQQQQQAANTSTDTGADKNIRPRAQTAEAKLTTTEFKTTNPSKTKGYGYPDNSIPEKPKMTLNERLGLDPKGNRIIKPQAQDTTTATKEKKPGILSRWFGNKTGNQSKEPSFTTTQSGTSSTTGVTSATGTSSGSGYKTDEKKPRIPRLELKFNNVGKSKQNNNEQRPPKLPERPKGLATKIEMTNDWDEVIHNSQRLYGPNVKLDQYGLPELEDWERVFTPITKPGYGGTVMTLIPKNKNNTSSGNNETNITKF